ncbi:MAG: murein L,D-transpeptidase catalytic domain family protein [Cytophagaceae bacterium]
MSIFIETGTKKSLFLSIDSMTFTRKIYLILFLISLSVSSLFAASNNTAVFENYIKDIYTSTGLREKGLSYEVFRLGMVGYYNMKHKDLLSDKGILGIVDFDKPSTEQRLWIIDVNKKEVLYHSLVAHGKKSGENKATNFSNCQSSNMSSVGFYVTRNTYTGKHGLSLVIDGLDKNFNSNAKERAVVIHSADYVSEDFIKCNGRLGRSQGCPAIPVENHEQVINTLKDGTALFIHSPCVHYTSSYLDEKTAVKEFSKLK